MDNKNVMNISENILWLSILFLSIISYLVNAKYSVILIFWIVIILSVGNAKRLYSKKYLTLSTIFRRSIYVFPFMFPLIINFKVNIISENLILWCLFGFLMGFLFILPKLNEWRIALSSELIALSSKRLRVDYYTQIGMYMGAAIVEEIFFRNFVIGYIDDVPLLLSIILSSSLFFLNHFGVKWYSNFDLYDFIIQISFGIASSILFIISKSIIPCIVAHFIYNSPGVLQAMKCLCYHYKNNKEELIDEKSN